MSVTESLRRNNREGAEGPNDVLKAVGIIGAGGNNNLRLRTGSGGFLSQTSGLGLRGFFFLASEESGAAFAPLFAGIVLAAFFAASSGSMI